MDITTQFVDVNTIKPNKFENLDQKSIKNDKNLKGVCDSFEAFFMNQFLELSLKDTSTAGKGTGSEIIRGMYTDALSQESAGTMGISDMLYKFLSENKS